MGIFDREFERGPQLIAVERAVAGAVHPARRKLGPGIEAAPRAAGTVARTVAVKTNAARPKIFGAARSEEAAETKAVIGERDRTVRIAVARCNRIAEARDQKIANRDLSAGATQRQPGRRDVGGNFARLAVAHPEGDRHRAIDVFGEWLGIAVFEAPGAPGARRNGAVEPRGHAMVRRIEIALLDAVTQALLCDLPDCVDAQPLHDVARPAASVGRHFERLLGFKDGAPARRFDVAEEIVFAAEQAEAVGDLPIDRDAIGGLDRRRRGRHRQVGGVRRRCCGLALRRCCLRRCGLRRYGLNGRGLRLRNWRRWTRNGRRRHRLRAGGCRCPNRNQHSGRRDDETRQTQHDKKLSMRNNSASETTQHQKLASKQRAENLATTEPRQKDRAARL